MVHRGDPSKPVTLYESHATRELHQLQQLPEVKGEGIPSGEKEGENITKFDKVEQNPEEVTESVSYVI